MTRLIAWAAGLTLFAAGCACDPGREAQRLAGSRATDCGYAALDEDMAVVSDCLDAAIAAGDSAYGGWALVSRDSGLRQYFVVRPDRTYRLYHDGSKDRLTITPCLGAPVRVDDGYTCDGELLDSYEFCD
jgi:hypothetical protein